MSPRATALLLFVGCTWGASFLFIRVALDEVSPLQIVFFRSLGGSLALSLVVARLRPPLDLRPSRLGYPAVLAAVGTLMPFALIGWAETHVSSGVASIYNAIVPLFTVGLAVPLIAEERLTGERLLGIGCGLAGSLVLIGTDVRDLTSANVVAQGALILASFGYGASAVITRFALRNWHTVGLSAVQIPILWLYSAVILVATGRLPSLDLALDTWLALLALGVLGTGFAYIAYYALLREVGPVRSSLVTYVIPVVGVILGALVLNESVAWNTLVGGLVIVLGVGLGTGGLRRLRETLAAG